jgi:uncharacterized protein (DUF1778 family)
LTILVVPAEDGPVRAQVTLRLSREELALLDGASRRLRLDRAALIRAAALGTAELVLEAARPLVLAVEPAELLRRVGERLRAEPASGPAPRGARRSRRGAGAR